ncbi:TPA: ATP-dependent Clp protease proteolytic subunit [Candidatus Bipolaricaulota bacterium]|nr:ATP-dependent Clp protease proteolytic subunit [Candidatus Bipolaricaulota bacterium]
MSEYKGDPRYKLQIPFVIDRTGQFERVYDIYSRLLEERIIFVKDVIDDYVADLVIAQMLFLDSKDSEREINLYINTPGGAVTSGLAIYDTMQFVKSPVKTICIGQAASIGAVLLAAGTKGKRYSLPNSRILIHQPVGMAQGQAIDVKIHAEHLLEVRDQINRILAQHTGQPIERIEKDTDRDFFMTPEEAQAYGIIDEIIRPKKNTK